MSVREGFTAAAQLPGKRQGHGCVALVTEKVFIFGGRNGKSSLSDAHIYDPATNSFKRCEDLPVKRNGAACCALPDGRAFLCGGAASNKSFLKDAYVFHPESNVYEQVSDLPSERTGAGCCMLPDGRVFICGGSDGLTTLADAFIFDPRTNKYDRMVDLPVERYGHACCTLADGRVFITGGSTGEDGKGLLAENRVFDPISNAYTRVGDVPNLPSPRTLLGCCTLPTGRVFVCGGSDGRVSLPDALFVDLVALNVTEVTDMPTPRSKHGCCVLPDGRVYICGGLHGGTHGNLADAYFYSTGEVIASPTREVPQGADAPFDDDLDDGPPATMGHAVPAASRSSTPGSDDAGEPQTGAAVAPNGSGKIETLEEWIEHAEATLGTAPSRDVRQRARAARKRWETDVTRARERHDKTVRKATDSRVRALRELLAIADLADAVPDVKGDLGDAIRQMISHLPEAGGGRRGKRGKAASGGDVTAFVTSGNATSAAALPTPGTAAKRTRPDAHFCPISSEVMSAPVMISCGHSFEQSHLSEWFLRNDTCPVCRAPIVNKTMTANHALRHLIEEW